MAATGTLTFQGTVTPFASGGSRSYNVSIPISAGIDAALTIPAFSAFTAVAIPAGATGCIITPPPSNLIALTLKGVTGDTGIGMHLTNPQILTFAAGATTFGITPTGTLLGPVLVDFF